MWIITNGFSKSSCLDKIFSNTFFEAFSNKEGNEKYVISDGVFMLVEGIVFYRNESGESIPKIDDLITLYKQNNNTFIKKLKGEFTILVINKSKLNVFGSYFGIQKFFYHKNDNEVIISNHIIGIKEFKHLKVSQLSFALYGLTYHFTSGRTAFEGVFHNTPGEILELSENGFVLSKYWETGYLLEPSLHKNSIETISDTLKRAVSISFERNEKVSLSLTGGADTRNLLAIFLSLGIKPHLYTYGNPYSNDCVKAKKIAEGLKLDHSIYDIQMTEDLFETYARRIISISSGMTSIHRVHRLIAVESEVNYATKMYLGTLGGEFIKGVSEDDYIVPSIVYENYNKPQLHTDDLSKYLNVKRIELSDELKKNVLNELNEEPYMKGSEVERKLNALVYITAHLHDAQDVNIYKSVMAEVYTPFLDIDYIETVFSSDFTFNAKEQYKNYYRRKVENPVYSSNFLKQTYPPLLKFEYSGEHKPSEVLFNKYFAAVIKMIRKKTTGAKPANFPLDTWMQEFVRKNLPLCKDYREITEIFDIDKLLQDFNTSEHKRSEAYWLKYTNPIMMRFIMEELSNGKN